MADPTESGRCLGCEKQCSAGLQCPTCFKYEKTGAKFCSQECFSANWNAHKTTHLDLHLALKKEFDEFQGPGQKKRLPATRLLELMYVLSSKEQKYTWGAESIKNGFNADTIDNVWRRDLHLMRFIDYKFQGDLRPWPLSRSRFVPDNIIKPDYGSHRLGLPKSEIKAQNMGNKIETVNEETIERLRKASKIGRQALDLANSLIKPGITTEEVDKQVHELIVSEGGYPSPLNYYNFPKSCCTSVNEVICHGVPDMRPLVDGDICNVDITVYIHGVHSDLNETFFVGTPTSATKKLVLGAYACLMDAVKALKPGMLYRKIGDIIHKRADALGLSVTRAYCGHGINHLFHCAPNVPHYRRNKAIGKLQKGHVFTIEPMINQGTHDTDLWPDDWTAVTTDGKWSAQFEHTFLVTEDGVEILTARNGESPTLGFDEDDYDAELTKISA